MVRVWLDAVSTEIPIAEVIAKGLRQFYADLASTHEDHKDNTDYARYRVFYCADELTEEDLKTITDDDALRVVPAKPPLNPPPTEQKCREIDEAIHALTAPLRNPDDRRVYGFNHEFGQPDHMSKIIDAHPKLCRDPHLLTILKDWHLFRAYIVNNEYKDDPARNAFKYENPDFYEAVKRLIVTIAASYGIRYIERPAAEAAAASAAPMTVTHQLLQNALQAALSGARLPGTPAQQPAASSFQTSSFGASSSSGSLASSSSGPSMQSTSAPVELPDELKYAEQIATLRSFGFESDELILLALQESNGNLEVAMEFLIDMHN